MEVYVYLYISISNYLSIIYLFVLNDLYIVTSMARKMLPFNPVASHHHKHTKTYLQESKYLISRN